MTIIPRFAATHHHHGQSSHGIHHRMRHPGPIMMYQSHQPSRAELHQHSHHHHHHAPHPHHHHSTTLQQQQQQQQTHPSNYPPPPTSVHFHSHYPHQSNHNTPHNSLAHPPFSALHDPLPPPLPAPPILQKPPLKGKISLTLTHIMDMTNFHIIWFRKNSHVFN
uniref:Uncharacterized protein n=1 Tax=Lepeophtheirus salmonis TaxID=72036 RepID=A0A0K2SZ98_LEPSM